MRLRHLHVENFRGIRALDWTVPDDLVCLVGPGDATKTTILDAIELVLLPRWAVTLDDSDFFGGDTSKSIVLRVTVTELPSELMSDSRFARDLRGWTNGHLIDEPEGEAEPALTIQFECDATLEPRWSVIHERNAEGRSINHRDRALLAVLRFGSGADRQFTWGQGSLLARLSNEVSASAELAKAARIARTSVTFDSNTALDQGIARATAAAKRLGLGLRDPRAALDPAAVALRTGAVALHQGDVPFRRAGLGTRTLLAMAAQVDLGAAGAVGLVDEVEQGLEPHRLRAVLRALKVSGGQVFATSHSPITLGELGPAHVNVVRSQAGVTTVRSVDPTLRQFLLNQTETLLASKILMCEGRTELGFCRGLDLWWGDGGTTFAYGGVALCDGKGSEAAHIALNFRSLGYDVLVFADSDRSTTPGDDQLRAEGIIVLRWPEKRSIEDQIVRELDVAGLTALVDLALSLHDDAGRQTAIRKSLATALRLDPERVPDDLSECLRAVSLESARAAVARAAQRAVDQKLNGWFKRADLGEQLAAFVLPRVAANVDSDVLRVAGQLRAWAASDER
jgi:hypothetical protein